MRSTDIDGVRSWLAVGCIRSVLPVAALLVESALDNQRRGIPDALYLSRLSVRAIGRRLRLSDETATLALQALQSVHYESHTAIVAGLIGLVLPPRPTQRASIVVTPTLRLVIAGEYANDEVRA